MEQSVTPPLSGRRYLGDGTLEALAEVTPLPAWPSPLPLMVPAADMTADIMALMEDRSPFCRLSSGPPASSDAPFTAAVKVRAAAPQ